MMALDVVVVNFLMTGNQQPKGTDIHCSLIDES